MASSCADAPRIKRLRERTPSTEHPSPLGFTPIHAPAPVSAPPGIQKQLEALSAVDDLLKNLRTRNAHLEIQNWQVKTHNEHLADTQNEQLTAHYNQIGLVFQQRDVALQHAVYHRDLEISQLRATIEEQDASLVHMGDNITILEQKINAKAKTVVKLKADIESNRRIRIWRTEGSRQLLDQLKQEQEAHRMTRAEKWAEKRAHDQAMHEKNEYIGGLQRKLEHKIGEDLSAPPGLEQDPGRQREWHSRGMGAEPDQYSDDQHSVNQHSDDQHSDGALYEEEVGYETAPRNLLLQQQSVQEARVEAQGGTSYVMERRADPSEHYSQIAGWMRKLISWW